MLAYLGEEGVGAGEEEGGRGLGGGEPGEGRLAGQESLLSQLRLAGTSLMLHRCTTEHSDIRKIGKVSAAPPTVLVHAAVEAFLESAGAALVAVSFVNRAAALQVGSRLAGVDAAPVDGALKKSRAACKKIFVVCLFCT